MARLVQPQRTFINLSYSLITIFMSLLFCEFGACDIRIKCGKSYDSRDDEFESYQINLRNLLANMASNASSSSFHNSTVGSPPNKAYGLYYCRGDTTTKLCHSCVVEVTKSLADETKSCGEGFGFSDNCMVHYANYSFFGRSDNTRVWLTYSPADVANVVEFNTTVRGVIEGVVEDAAFESVGLFATREAIVGRGDGGKVRGLAQCTPNIGRVNCSGCLKTAASHVEECCEGSKSVWAMFSSCQLRYDYSNANVEVVSSGALLIACSTLLLIFNWMVW